MRKSRAWAGARVAARMADQILHLSNNRTRIWSWRIPYCRERYSMQSNGLEAGMPTILSSHGYRLYFYSHEPGEPPHVHVDSAGSTMKVWLEDLGVAKSRGFRGKERNAILKTRLAEAVIAVRTFAAMHPPAIAPPVVVNVISSMTSHALFLRSLEFSREAKGALGRAVRTPWQHGIPAFAGMTELENRDSPRLLPPWSRSEGTGESSFRWNDAREDLLAASSQSHACHISIA